MPWRAISIIPLLMAAPANTPTEAIIMIVLNLAALAPIAELRKIYSVVAHSHREVEYGKDKQENDNT